jgi:Uncharacterized conserved protein (DUF2183)
MFLIPNLWVTLLSFQGLSSYFTGKIGPKERVIFFPTAASRWNATHWHVPIHGWIFEPEENSKKRAFFRSLLRRALKVDSGSAEKKILDRRIKPFVVDNERWKRPKIHLSGKEYSLSWSGKNGHFQTSLILSQTDLFKDTSTTTSIAPSSLSYFALSSDHKRTFEGRVHMVPPKGITILSDIDDTIKITNVVNKKEMLRNTFMREFQPVPGMSDVYTEWCSAANFASDKDDDIKEDDVKEDNGEGLRHVHLHFLSASLYQLYEDLERFRSDFGFPLATYTLKIVRPKDAGKTIQILLEDALEFKRRSITKILERFPERHFILVGDTGEKDPQVYASIAREYRRQVLGIYLRSVSRSTCTTIGAAAADGSATGAATDGTTASDNNGDGDDKRLGDVPTRVREVMKEYGIDDSLWTLFEDASELQTVDLRKLFQNR